MNRVLFLLLISVIFSLGLRAQDVEEPKILRDRTFMGAALYGFMNGGSELYLEYDFIELRALEVQFREGEYTIEIYRMKTPEDAYGIYSVNAHRYKVCDTLTLFTADWYSSHQIQIADGPYYITVVFQKECSGFNRDALELLGYFYNSGMSNQKLQLPPLYSDEVVKPTSKLKYVRGPISIMNTYPQLNNILSNCDNLKLWILSEQGFEKRRAIMLTDSNNVLTILNEGYSGTYVKRGEKEYFEFEFL